MTVRVVGWRYVGLYPRNEPDVRRNPGTCCTTPLVSLPAVIEELEACVARGKAPGSLDWNFVDSDRLNTFLTELKQLTTPADAGGRVK